MGLIRRHGVRFALGTAATVAFLILFLRQVDLGEAWEEMRQLPGWTLLASLGLILVNVTAMTVRWGLLLEGAGHTVRFRQLFATVAMGRAANNVLPARGGDLLRIESLRETNGVPVFVTAGTLFAERLLDYDPAQNEGNWQWVAGTGIDAQPWFRIFNPERQRERFDADGTYCRRWLPEWGTDAYPEPMVDLSVEAAEAKERFRAASRS